MQLDEIYMSDKIKKLLNPNYDKKVTYLGGTSGTSKSLILMSWLIMKVLKTGQPGFFCCESSVKFYQQFIGDVNSVYQAWKEVGLVEYKGVGTSGGGQRIVVKTKWGPINIYIANYSNSASWGKVLGTSLKWFAIDEANIAHEQAIRRSDICVLHRNGGMAMLNSNGDSPYNYMYEIVNRCTPDPDFLMPK